MSDLPSLLLEAAEQLDQMTAAVQDARDEALDDLALGVRRAETAVREATQDWEGPPTSAETDAFNRWQDAAARLTTAVKERLRSVDGMLGDLHQTSRVINAYATLQSHHVAQKLTKKL